MEFGCGTYGGAFLESGFWLRKTEILDKIRDMEIVKRLSCFIIMIGIGYYSIYYNPISIVSFVTNSYGNFFMMISGALCISGAVFCFTYEYLNKKNVITDVLSFWGKSSIYFMAFNYMIRNFAYTICEKLGLSIGINLIIELMMLSLVSFVILSCKKEISKFKRLKKLHA